MRSALLLLVMILTLAALAALLWWRFKGSGQPVASAPVLATRNHHSLRTFHYESAAAAQLTTAVSSEAGAVLARLLPQEDLAISKSRQPAEDEPLTTLPDSPPPAAGLPSKAPQSIPANESPRPASIRHAAGAVASLLDGPPGEATAAASTPGSVGETDEEPAEALFYNPLTAPAPTANDQANRAAEIALRQQRRVRMSANAGAQRVALSGLFPGAGSLIPTTKPS